jgi:hypothetical protein
MNIAAVILILLAVVLTAGIGANVDQLHRSDAAGNGMADAFAYLFAVVVWIIVAVLLLICGARGGSSGRAGFAIVCVFLLAIAGQMVALRLLTASKTEGPAAFLLPIVILAGPILLIIRAAWGIFPALRASIPELAGGWAPIALLALISLIPFPFLPSYLARKTAAEVNAALVNQENQEKQKAQTHLDTQETLAKIAALPSDGPLFSAIVYCADPEPAIRDAARAKARTFPNRQADAEELLAQHHEPTLRELPNFDVAATPAVCASAKRILASKAAIKPFDNDPVRIEDAEREVAPYIDSMRWLLAHGCDCAAEIGGVEQAVGRFANSPRREKLLADLSAAKAGK